MTKKSANGKKPAGKSASPASASAQTDAMKAAAEALKNASASVSEEALNAAKAAEEAEQKRLPDSAEKIAAFGNAVWLMMHAKTHKHLFVTDMEWACEPPIALNQCYFWHRGHVPVGFASWAYLSEEAEQRMMQGIRKLGPADWNSGDRLWLMDLIIPFGGQQEAAKELKEKVFKDKKVKSLQPAPDGQGMAVVEW